MNVHKILLKHAMLIQVFLNGSMETDGFHKMAWCKELLLTSLTDSDIVVSERSG